VLLLLVIHSILSRWNIPIPTGFHFVQISLHCINASLVLSISNILLGSSNDISLFVSLLFFIHTINTRTILCIDAFGEEVSTFLFLVAFLLYMKRAVCIVQDVQGMGNLQSKTFIFVLCILAVGLEAFFIDLNLAPLLFFSLLDTLVNISQRRQNIGTLILHNLLIVFETLFILGIRSLMLHEHFFSFVRLTYQQFGSPKILGPLSDFFIGFIYLVHGLSLLLIPTNLSPFYTHESFILTFIEPHSDHFSKFALSIGLLLLFFLQIFKSFQSYYALVKTSFLLKHNNTSAENGENTCDGSSPKSGPQTSPTHSSLNDEQKKCPVEKLNQIPASSHNDSDKFSLEEYCLQKFRIILLSALLVTFFLPFVQHFGILPFLSVQPYPVQFHEPILYTPSFTYAVSIGVIMKKTFSGSRARIIALFVLFLFLLKLSFVRILHYSDEVLLLYPSLKLFPKNIEIMTRLNTILKERNDTHFINEHIDILNALIAIFPTHCPFRHDLALALLKKGSYKEAQSAEQNALSCTQWCHSAYAASLAEIYIKQNQLWKAESLLRRAQILFKDGSGLHLLGTCTFHQQ